MILNSGCHLHYATPAFLAPSLDSVCLPGAEVGSFLHPPTKKDVEPAQIREGCRAGNHVEMPANRFSQIRKGLPSQI
jgi:hypothetical protein